MEILISENDKLVIPEKFLKMSVSELEQEEERLLKSAKERAKNIVGKKKDNTVNINFYL